jgi:hypothetical protein
MDKKITAILAVILVSMFSFTAIGEAQNMDANKKQK